MKIAIVDDDEKQTSLLTQYITAESAVFSDCEHQLITFSSGEAFLDNWSSGTYDLIILDIFMGELTGMDVAFRIRESDPNVLLVFCTSSNEFASESYEVGAQHYLRKPVTQNDIKRMFQRLDPDSYERSRVIHLPDEHAVIPHDILYTDYENHVVTVHFKDAQSYRLRTRQSDIEELLLPCGYFCTPYKGVTVNFHAVVTLTNDTITLSDGTNIPLTRRKTKEVKEAYKKFCFQQMKKKVGGIMPPLYRILEVALYAMLNFLPFMLIALLPFRTKYRFSNPVTVLLVGIMTLVQMCLGVLSAFGNSNVALLSAVSTIIYAVFYFITIKAHAGKIIFTLLMLSNIANFVVTASKCLEGVFFPELAVQDYRWSFSVFMILIEAVCLIPLYFFVKKTYTVIFETEIGRSIWWYLWLIPATFYFIWYYELYNSEKSSLQMALEPEHSMFLLIINLGSMLIYYLVVRLIREMCNNSALTEHNYQLAMQKLQYDNLWERINEARQAKHDIRHHVTVMDSYLSNGEYERLKEYLNGYKHSLPDYDTIFFCRHYAVNALLLYFAQQAKNNQVDFDVMVEIPENINMPDHALCVVFGNLLENALEACLDVNDRQKTIIIRGKTSPNAIFLEIANTYSGTVNKNAKGHYLSTKHNGRGIGLTSVQSLVAEYDGILEITQENGMFKVSALVNIPPK